MKKPTHYLDWIDNSMVCARCGKREPLELPIDIIELRKKMEKFKREHKDCKPDGNDS